MKRSLVMCQQADPGVQLEAAEEGAVIVETWAGAVLLELEDGTRLAFIREDLKDALTVSSDRMGRAA